MTSVATAVYHVKLNRQRVYIITELDESAVRDWCNQEFGSKWLHNRLPLDGFGIVDVLAQLGNVPFVGFKPTQIVVLADGTVIKLKA